MSTVTATRKTAASPAATAAIKLSRSCLDEMEVVRTTMGDRMSELAGRRADAIRTALDEGMTQADVARALGITAQAVHNILRQH
jgi:DNA-directed RNA polymerase specialized sigma24 family protein